MSQAPPKLPQQTNPPTSLTHATLAQIQVPQVVPPPALPNSSEFNKHYAQLIDQYNKLQRRVVILETRLNNVNLSGSGTPMSWSPL